MVSITNFRDIGGIANRQGEVVKEKIFLRSGELTRVSKEDQKKLKEFYQLSKIIDFRSEKEINERPDQTIPDATYVHIDIIKNIHEEGASLDDFVVIGSVEKARNYMQKLYCDIALDPIAQKGYQQFFEEIIDLPKEKSVLFHCFAGKDRTGIGAALILEALDVSREIIYHDYLQTNQLRKKENAYLLDEAREKNLGNEQVAALEIALKVEQGYLHAFYQSVEEHFGSVTVYLEQAIGMNYSMRKTLQEHFLMKK